MWNNLQVLGIKAELLAAFWAVASVALDDLPRSFEFKARVEEFAAFAA